MPDTSYSKRAPGTSTVLTPTKYKDSFPQTWIVSSSPVPLRHRELPPQNVAVKALVEDSTPSRNRLSGRRNRSPASVSLELEPSTNQALPLSPSISPSITPSSSSSTLDTPSQPTAEFRNISDSIVLEAETESAASRTDQPERQQEHESKPDSKTDDTSKDEQEHEQKHPQQIMLASVSNEKNKKRWRLKRLFLKDTKGFGPYPDQPEAPRTPQPKFSLFRSSWTSPRNRFGFPPAGGELSLGGRDPTKTDPTTTKHPSNRAENLVDSREPNAETDQADRLSSTVAFFRRQSIVQFPLRASPQSTGSYHMGDAPARVPFMSSTYSPSGGSTTISPPMSTTYSISAIGGT